MDRLLEGVELLDIDGEASGVEVTSIEFDSRTVNAGALFCCVPGRVHDGHDHAGEAVEAGAVGLVVERRLPLATPQAVLRPGTVRRAMARISRTFYDDPASSLLTVGVTGTNGKTTVTRLLASVLETAYSEPCTVIGTLDGPRTTPEAPELQRLLAGARDRGQRCVCMEVSSHALTEGRVDGIFFSAAVFTNLSHDHLDHHGTMESYFAAKASLFEPDRAALGVVNTDDEWGRRLVDRAQIPVVPFASTDASDVTTTVDGTAFTWHGRRVVLALRGAYHVAAARALATW